MDKDAQLTDGFVLLRPYRLTDVNDLFEAASESIPEMSFWMPWCHPDYSIEESRAWVKERPEKWSQGTAYDFVVTDATSGRYLGGCGINGINRDIGFANLGYWVRTSQTKKGIATAATLLLARFAFSELKLNRVELVIGVNNVASLRVAEKVRATREGILRNRLIIDGKPGDAVMFSLIPQDFI